MGRTKKDDTNQRILSNPNVVTPLLALFLAIQPSQSLWVVLAIFLGEIVFGDAKKPTPQLNGFSLVFVCASFIVYSVRASFETMNVMETLSLSILTATLWLSWSHSLVHKYKLYNLSVFYSLHKKHHSIEECPELQLRKEGLFSYVSNKIVLYVKAKWGIVDWFVLPVVIFSGFDGIIAFILGLIMIETIGFQQHTSRGDTVDSKNFIMNLLGDNAGFHGIHHNGQHSQYNWRFGAVTGLLAAATWLIVCGFLRVLLFLPWPQANIPGAYLFGFRQNVGNYIAANGHSVRNLLYRIPSVFENPCLIFEYLVAMNRNEGFKDFTISAKETPLSEPVRLSHGVVQSRNIYVMNPSQRSNAQIIMYQGEVIEGHHRVSAGLHGSIIELTPL